MDAREDPRAAGGARAVRRRSRSRPACARSPSRRRSTRAPTRRRARGLGQGAGAAGRGECPRSSCRPRPPSATRCSTSCPRRRSRAGRRPRPPTLPTSELIAFMPTTNLAAARVFYEKGLGLPIAGESPIACTFDANGTTLRVIAVEKIDVAPYTVLGWNVADIEASIRELTSRGVVFERHRGRRPGRSRRLALAGRRARRVASGTPTATRCRSRSSEAPAILAPHDRRRDPQAARGNRPDALHLGPEGQRRDHADVRRGGRRATSTRCSRGSRPRAASSTARCRSSPPAAA